MSRQPLLHMLARYRDTFPDEAAMVDRICRLVESNANCFDRACRPGHITGAAWILSTDRRRALLAHHRKLDRWLQLGGHAMKAAVDPWFHAQNAGRGNRLQRTA